MPELGPLLELLYGAHRGVNAMFVETRDWWRQEASDTLTVQPDTDGRMRIHWTGGGPYARPAVVSRQVWFEPPGRIRVELLHNDTVVRTAVREGNAWWRWDLDDGESAGDLTQGAVLPAMLDLPLLTPAHLVSSMWFEATGTATRTGRPVMTATAAPRQPTNGMQRNLTFEFDLEHGTPLHMATFEAGERISLTEVLAVDYAPSIDHTTFTFATLASSNSQRSTTTTPPPQSRNPIQASPSNQRPFAVPHAVLASHQTIWLTGLPGAGKTTIAKATERLLHQLGARCCVLDGDQIRQGLSTDLGLTREDRREQARRVAHMAALLGDSGIVPIVALVSPYAEDRQLARNIHNAASVGFLEVWVNTPLEVCIARDPKGLYAAAAPAESNMSDRGGSQLDGSGVTGLTAPYEAPISPDLCVNGDEARPRIAATRIVEKMLSRPA